MSNSQIKPRKVDLVNENIRFNQILLLDEDGTKLGIQSKDDALALAKSRGYDLVCVAPTAKPPVCKLMDYGKYKYLQKKAENQARKRQHVILNKEVRITPTIGDHDFDVKTNQAYRFLKAGHRVKVSLKFRGREQTYAEQGYATLMRFYDRVKDVCKMEKKPTLNNWFYDMYLIGQKPSKKGKETQSHAKNAHEKSSSKTDSQPES